MGRGSPRCGARVYRGGSWTVLCSAGQGRVEQRIEVQNRAEQLSAAQCLRAQPQEMTVELLVARACVVVATHLAMVAAVKLPVNLINSAVTRVGRHAGTRTRRRTGQLARVDRLTSQHDAAYVSNSCSIQGVRYVFFSLTLDCAERCEARRTARQSAKGFFVVSGSCF